MAELDLVKEKSDQVLIRTTAYDKVVAKYYNKKISSKDFQG